MFRIIFFGLVIALSGCQTTQHKSLVELEQPLMTSTFDPAAVAFVLKPGTATLSGEISSVERAGAIVRGKYAKVRLVPVTPYSDEYFRRLFRGKKVFRWNSRVEGLAIDFNKYMRRTISDKNGHYKFFGVPAGQYYVYAISARSSRTFAAYERVTIAAGQSLTQAIDGL